MLLPLQLNLEGGPHDPAFIGPDISDLTFPEDIEITPVDLTEGFGWTTTYILIGDLPEGMVFTNGILSGEPTTPGVYGPFVIRAI